MRPEIMVVTHRDRMRRELELRLGQAAGVAGGRCWDLSDLFALSQLPALAIVDVLELFPRPDCWDLPLSSAPAMPVLVLGFRGDKVGLSTWHDANDSRDGYAQLIPSTTANPYTGAFSYINSFYTDGYVPEKRQSVTAHELGHVLGLGHADGAVLMNPFTNVRWDQGRINQPTADDRAGVNALYQ